MVKEVKENEATEPASADSKASERAEAKAEKSTKKVVKKSTRKVTRKPAVIPHQMATAIKNSRKGKIPAGLAKYLAAKKSGKK